MVLAVLGSAVPATGGMYTYVRDYIGPKTGFYYLALLVAGQLVLAMFAITFATYCCSLIPGLNETFVAAAILTICYLMNLFGIELAAKLQNLLVAILLMAMGAFIIFGLPKVNWAVFTEAHAIMPNGFINFLTAASLLTFATGGAEFLSELGGEMKNPGRDLPRVLLTIFYIIGLVPILTGLNLETIAMLGNGVSLIYVLFPIFTGYLIYKKNPKAMQASGFKVSKPVLYVLTTVALIGYIIAAVLNFSDIENAWQMMLIYSVIVIVYAWFREKYVLKRKA